MIGFYDLQDQTLHHDSGDTAKIHDLWFDLRTGDISHVLLDLGRLLRPDLALITPDRIDRATWTLRTTQGELDRAPRWREPVDGMTPHWPPIVIGPFGNTLSLPLLAAQLGQTRNPEPDAIAQALSDTTDAATDVISASVFARDGELGSVRDLRIAPDRWAVTGIVVTAPQGTVTVPLPHIRRQVDAARGGHIVLQGPREAYSAAA